MVNLDGKKDYVIKFYADWCAPCKVLAPRVAEVSKETGIEVVSVNIDEESEFAQKYGVRGIPMLVAVKDDAPIGALTGARTKDEVTELFLKVR